MTPSQPSHRPPRSAHDKPPEPPPHEVPEPDVPPTAPERDPPEVIDPPAPGQDDAPVREPGRAPPLRA